MRQTAIGVIVATLVMYVWGFLYWGANPAPYMTWDRASDDAAAVEALRELFPETGTYYVPGLYVDEPARTELHVKGPVGFVHITAHDGRNVYDSSPMIQGLFLNLVVVVLVAALMRLAAPALPGYGDRAKLALLVGVAAAVMIDFGGAVWWFLAWDWQAALALYNASAMTIAGLVLAYFIRPESAPA